MSTAKWNAVVVLLASVALMAGLAVSPAYAAIAIENSSFETPTTSGWLSWDLFGDPMGWTNDDITDKCGVINIPAYKGTAFDANLTGYDGSQGLILDGRIIDEHVPGDVYQNVGSVAFDSNVQLTVAVGRETAAANAPAPFTISLWKDTDADDVPDTVLASAHYPITSLVITALQDFSVTATDVAADTNIYVRLSVDGSDKEVVTQALFDNVRVTCSPVPEPGALTLLVIGMTGLACYARRKCR